MALQQLIPSQNLVNVQSTTFTIDAFGRYICSTFDEAALNAGPPFDVIVIGAGMYGSYCASKVNQFAPDKRVLVLDAGAFLLPEHVQNFPQLDFNVPGEIVPSEEPGTARELVWGIPWRGNVPFPGLAYCVGGKSIYWGGWCPQLTPTDLLSWPPSASAYLNDNYGVLANEIGVEPSTDFISGALQAILKTQTISAASTVSNIELGIGEGGVEEAPLAVQSASPAPGLFSFDKFSSVPALVDAIRRDVRQSNENDANRNIFLVPNSHVIRLFANAGRVDSIELQSAGQRKFLNLSPSSTVVIATSTIETTRLALLSFPTPLMGRNLMAHIRSDFTVRIRRSSFSGLPSDLDTAALLVRGISTTSSRFHIQITASAFADGPAGQRSDALLYRIIPDLDLLRQQLANDDPEWVSITFRGVGEMKGDKLTPIPNSDGSWINLSPFEEDEFGAARAYIQLNLAPNDLQTWNEMDQATLDLCQKIAGNPSNIQYLYDGGWQTTPFPLDRSFPEWRRGLGTTYHEGGTLWMGTDPLTSVTNELGRFHHIENAYACDQSIFPTVGSINPVLTGLTLARRIAQTLSS